VTLILAENMNKSKQVNIMKKEKVSQNMEIPKNGKFN
jgi:hypothetical protein